MSCALLLQEKIEPADFTAVIPLLSSLKLSLQYLWLHVCVAPSEYSPSLYCNEQIRFQKLSYPNLLGPEDQSIMTNEDEHGLQRPITMSWPILTHTGTLTLSFFTFA